MTLLDQWADACSPSRGIERIKGDLVYYDRTFDDEWLCPSWSRGYITDRYAAPISGLNFNNNCIDLTIKPTEGWPVTYKVTPPTRDVKVHVQCKTGEGRSPDVDRENDRNLFIVSERDDPADGSQERSDRQPRCVLRGRPPHAPGEQGDHHRRQHPPRRQAARRLGDPTNQQNRRHARNQNLRRPQAASTAKARTTSPKASSRCLAGIQKQGKDEPGSWANGEIATKAFLKANNIDASKYVAADGSGLSRENRVTSRLISDVFVTMWKHPKETYFESLGIGGIDGTIKSRFDDLKDRVRAKTGYIGGVRSLSGYVQNDDGHWIVFSIIFNGFQGKRKAVRALQDNAVRVLAAWPKEAKLPATTRSTTTAAVAGQ